MCGGTAPNRGHHFGTIHLKHSHSLSKPTLFLEVMFGTRAQCEVCGIPNDNHGMTPHHKHRMRHNTPVPQVVPPTHPTTTAIYRNYTIVHCSALKEKLPWLPWVAVANHKVLMTDLTHKAPSSCPDTPHP